MIKCTIDDVIVKSLLSDVHFGPKAYSGIKLSFVQCNVGTLKKSHLQLLSVVAAASIETLSVNSCLFGFFCSLHLKFEQINMYETNTAEDLGSFTLPDGVFLILH